MSTPVEGHAPGRASRVLVGYDGSPSSSVAVQWAADEAVARGASLAIITCTPVPLGDSPDLAEAVVEQLRASHPTLSCTAQARVGPPREVLVEASHATDLLVVGKTGAGAVKSLILGSVANAVIRRSACPVALIPAGSVHRRSTERALGRVVVGVDGSPSSEAALDWALDEAESRGSELVLVKAWSFTYTGPVLDSAPAHDAAAEETARALSAMVVSASERRPAVAVCGKVVEDRAPAALLDAATSADLLVVGSRGRSGVRSIFFGSVAHAVIEHATCPTVVVPPACN